ncbi:MAG: exodeoxyribonuclease III [Spirochaetia bacterium]
MKNIISWNVNGIRAAERKGFFHWLSERNADIVCLQETKAKPEQLTKKFFSPEGYTSIWKSAERKGYSGVAVYTKKEPVSVSYLGVDEFDSEGRTLVLEYPEFVLITGYFPNSQPEGKRLDYKLGYCGEILKTCNSLVEQGKNIVLCGDYNIAHTPIDLANPKSNEKNPGYLPEERQWMTDFLDAGYVDMFRDQHPDEPGHYTWWSYRFQAREKDIGWRLDYHCVNKGFEDAVINSEILKHDMGSDHAPVRISLDV